MVAAIPRSAVRRDSNPLDYTTSDVAPLTLRTHRRTEEARVANKNQERTTNPTASPRGKVTKLPANYQATERSTSRSRAKTIAILILGGLVALLLLQLGMFLWNWGTDTLNTFRYGPTRTSIVSGVFGHNNDSAGRPTRVIAMNLSGSLLLEEIPAGDLSKVKAYPTAVTLVGSNPGTWPVTLTTTSGSKGPNVAVQIAGQNTALTLVNNGSDSSDFTLTST